MDLFIFCIVPPSCSSRDTRICKFSAAVECVLGALSWAITPFLHASLHEKQFLPQVLEHIHLLSQPGECSTWRLLEGKSIWLHNAVGFIPIIGPTSSSTFVFVMYMTFSTQKERRKLVGNVHIWRNCGSLLRGALLRQSHWLLKLLGCAECPWPPWVPRGAEPAISCPSNGLWHRKMHSLSSLLLSSFLWLVLSLINACPGRGRGQEQGRALWEGRAALADAACTWVSWKWWWSCSRASAWVGLSWSLMAFCILINKSNA